MCILANELSICVLICACRHVYCTCAVSCIVDRVGVVAACLGTLRDGEELVTGSAESAEPL